jgi:hypothetical protein
VACSERVTAGQQDESRQHLAVTSKDHVSSISVVVGKDGKRALESGQRGGRVRMIEEELFHCLNAAVL